MISILNTDKINPLQVGVQFCYQPSRRNGPTARFFRHMFDMRCQENGIEHRCFHCPAVKHYHYETHDQLRTHLQLFLDAYNHAKRLKALKGLTPYEFICKAWTEKPERFIKNPTNHTLGLNT